MSIFKEYQPYGTYYELTEKDKKFYDSEGYIQIEYETKPKQEPIKGILYRYDQNFSKKWIDFFRKILESILLEKNDYYLIGEDMDRVRVRYFLSLDHGIILIEGFPENFLIEVRSEKYKKGVFDLLKRKGCQPNIVGERKFINVKREILER